MTPPSRLLLDTHVFLWWLDEPRLLSDPARIEIANPRNAVFVSAVCVQEIVLKQARNRLACPEPILPLIDANMIVTSRTVIRPP